MVTWIGESWEELEPDKSFKDSLIGGRGVAFPKLPDLDKTCCAMTWLDVGGVEWSAVGRAFDELSGGSMERCVIGCWDTSSDRECDMGTDTPWATNNSSRFFAAASIDVLKPTFSRQVRYILKASADCSKGEAGSYTLMN